MIFLLEHGLARNEEGAPGSIVSMGGSDLKGPLLLLKAGRVSSNAGNS